ncbi:MAG: hypothetical protein AB8B77_01720 [Alphaproteobacteria bacterium]
MRPAVDNTLMIALWLEDRAREDQVRLSPQHLHQLLYLLQTIYALDFKGQMLMPAQFVAFKDGVREPTLYAVMSELNFFDDPLPLPAQILQFLEQFWAKFNEKSEAMLIKEIKKHPPYDQAISKGTGALIAFEEIAEHARQHKISTHVKVADGRKLPRWTPERHLAAAKS